MRHVFLVVPAAFVAALFVGAADVVLLTAGHEKGITVSAPKGRGTVTATQTGVNKVMWVADLSRDWRPGRGEPEAHVLAVVGDRVRITNAAGAYLELDVRTGKVIETGARASAPLVCSCCPLPKDPPALPAKPPASLSSVIRTDFTNPTGGLQAGHAQYKHLWRPGADLSVVFLDGDKAAQKRVQDIANEWTKHANIRFSFYASEGDWPPARGLLGCAHDGDPTWRAMTGEQKRLWYRQKYTPAIVITFAGTGYNSEIGMHSFAACYHGRHSMRLGGLDKVTDDKVWRGVVLHEFGHALGLEHEHKSPAAGIKWNEAAVLDFYTVVGWKDKDGNKITWTKDEVKHNIFNAYKSTQTKHTQFDPKSIMVYSIPKEHTTDGYSVEENFELSETDKTFIAELYPKTK